MRVSFVHEFLCNFFPLAEGNPLCPPFAGELLDAGKDVIDGQEVYYYRTYEEVKAGELAMGAFEVSDRSLNITHEFWVAPSGNLVQVRVSQIGSDYVDDAGRRVVDFATTRTSGGGESNDLTTFRDWEPPVVTQPHGSMSKGRPCRQALCPMWARRWRARSLRRRRRRRLAGTWTRNATTSLRSDTSIDGRGRV